MSDLCLTHRRGDAEAQAGVLVCAGCESVILRDLAALPRLWDKMLILDGVEDVQGGGRRAPGSRPPSSLTVLAMTDLRSGDEPGGPPPVARWMKEAADRVSVALGRASALDLHAQVRLLRAEADWLLGQPWVAVFARRLSRSRAALRRICGEVRHVIDRCTVGLPDGSECGGALYQEADGVLEVYCARCGDRWGADEVSMSLQRLGLILGEDHD